MDKRIGIGVGTFLALEVMNEYQLVLPPLYGTDTFDERDVRQATKFVAVYILIIAFMFGALTTSPYPILLPAVALGLVYLFYMYELGKRMESDIHSHDTEED